MIQNKCLKSLDRPVTTHDITTDLDLDGSLPEAALVALGAYQIVKQLKGDYAVNSELNQKITTSYLQSVAEDNAAAVGRAATEATRDYYRALAESALANHREYQRLVEIQQTRLDRLNQPLR